MTTYVFGTGFDTIVVAGNLSLPDTYSLITPGGGSASLNLLAISPDGSTLVVCDGQNNCAYVIDTATMVVAHTLSGITFAWGVCFTPDGTKCLITASNSYPGSGTGLYIYNASTWSLISSVTSGAGFVTNAEPEEVCVSPDSTTAYMTDYGNGGIWVIDIATASVTRYVTTGASCPEGIAVTTDGTKVFMCDNCADSPGAVYVMNTSTFALTTVNTLDEPWNATPTPDGTAMWVSCEGNPGTTSPGWTVIDVSTLSATNIVNSGAFECFAGAITSDGTTAVQAGRSTGTAVGQFYVYDVATKTLTGTISATTSVLGGVALGPTGPTPPAGVAVADTAFTADSLSVRGHRLAALVAENAVTADSITASEVGVAAPTCVNRVISSAMGYATPTRPIIVPGPSGLHDYTVVVTDKYGVAYGQIVSAVPTQIEWVLDDLGEALIDFWILDPSAVTLLPVGQSFPGVREIQIWRDGALIWWGWPISATYDAKQVHLSCSGLLWPFGEVNFGPITTNYLANPSFEEPQTVPFVIPEWTGIGVTNTVVPKGGGNQVLVGNYSAQLNQADANTDTYIRQYVTVTGGGPGGTEGTLFTVSAWAYLDPNYAPAANQNGLFIQFIEGLSVVAGPNVEQITTDTGGATWVRLETSVEVPPNASGTIEVRLYAPQGITYWDDCKLTVPESVGSAPSGADAQYIMSLIVAYAQDPSRGHNDNAMPFIGPLTGVDLVRIYQFYDNGGVLDALNEYPTIGACDFEVTWDDTGHYRQFEIFPPAKGEMKYNYPLEIDLGTITDLQGSIDGSQTKTAVRWMGQGSADSSTELGYAAFPCALGGRTGTAGTTLGSTVLTSSDLNFTSADVGQGVYMLGGGVLQVGTIITSIISSVQVQMSKPAVYSVVSETAGVGGIVLDSVQSAIPDQPVTTLQASADNYLSRFLKSQVLPTARQRADGARGLFGNVTVGDVVPVMFNYGWLTLGALLMRITKLTLYPPTEELQAEVSALPLGQDTYG